MCCHGVSFLLCVELKSDVASLALHSTQGRVTETDRTPDMLWITSNDNEPYLELTAGAPGHDYVIILSLVKSCGINYSRATRHSHSWY